jgi:ABC-type phosphate transport system substrate-binding protein
VVFYAVVVVALFAYRNHFDWSRLTDAWRNRDQGPATLVVAGGDLAPRATVAVMSHFRRDYPALDLQTTGGGTNHALEDLLNQRADVAFLSRPPTPAEQGLFRTADGDTAIVMPVGIGGLLLLAGAEVLTDEPPTLTSLQLGGLLGGETQGLCERLYAADPNLGIWAAAADLLGRDPAPADTTTVVYLADDDAVTLAVANDPRALGLIVSYDLPVTAPRLIRGARLVSLADSTTAVAPTYENVATGAYPLFVPLLVACRGNGGIQGSKFVTYLASGPGQRRIERAGCVPAWQVQREVILTNEAPAKEGS